MRFIVGVYLFLIPIFAKAEEVVPVVGKHAASNLDSVSIILSLLLVLVFIVACAFILKKFQPNSVKLSGMKMITSMHLGTKEKLVVVEVDNKQLLLGVTANQITLIQTLENPIEVGQPLTMDIGQNIVKLLKKNEK
ncbi:flagellar biosynthetic protein FliO [Thalassotalea atypica]|uniref:flagellar biosynthetic protein FliO n=1 Tax=Thalassotalea atypica TaxID=2054316 RepID=UPI0025734A96|nr:flagellar biosynthetic protein FliO [Thalassotalea atypica]